MNDAGLRRRDEISEVEKKLDVRYVSVRINAAVWKESMESAGIMYFGYKCLISYLPMVIINHSIVNYHDICCRGCNMSQELKANAKRVIEKNAKKSGVVGVKPKKYITK